MERESPPEKHHAAPDPERREMVERQLIRRGIRDVAVLKAMAAVPREEFFPPQSRADAYSDGAFPIGSGQTISQPYMVARMVELLEVRPEHRVLEVGAGSGYQAAVLAELAREVYAVELIEELGLRAQRTLARLGYSNVEVVIGDGSLGHEAAAPYDGIIVAAAAPEIAPAWKEQLADGGRIVAPIGDMRMQTCTVAQKQGEELVVTADIGCVFVPLRGRYGQPE
ncbi:MAG TPA: protein-L-isoaspartate O-methyltransferase [Armatimonadetes bacterium]|jgi:protein-L-isoaspartate(D-aspartate) O-methyltransferase|nr:protein-L-isoaspartate O-methyltransferase [Armatimonadota bacterium]